MITDKQGVKTTSLDKPNIIFTLRDDNNNDTIYCFNPWKFILVPYFVKQKQIHEGKTFLAFNKNDNESFDVSSKKSADPSPFARFNSILSAREYQG